MESEPGVYGLLVLLGEGVFYFLESVLEPVPMEKKGHCDFGGVLENRPSFSPPE